MKRYLSILSVLFFSCQAGGQKMTYDNNNKLQLRILERELALRPNDEGLILNISVTNKSDSSFILYNFKILDPGSFPIKGLTQPDWVAQNAVFIFKGQEFFSILKFHPLPGIDLPLTLDSASYIEDIIERHGEVVYKNRLILKKNETWTGKLQVLVNKKILLNKKFFERTEKIKIGGEYDMFLIYGCGVNITNLIDEKRINEDEKANEAVVFQGYVRSNSIKLIIKE